MELQDAAIPTGPLPSARTIALAFSVVRSRPAQMSMADYIGLLSKHIANGRRSDALSSKYRHLDRSSFWRARCERVEKDLQAAQNVSLDQKMELDHVKAQLDALQSTTTQNSKKRKKFEQEVGASAKKVKRDDALLQDGFQGPYRRAGEVGVDLLRLVYQIHQNLQDSKQTGAEELACNLIGAATAIPQVVQSEVKACLKNTGIDCDRLQSALTVTSRAMSTVLLGYDRLSQIVASTYDLGGVIYEIVTMFKKLMGPLEQISMDEATRSRTTAPKAKSKSKAPKEPNVKNIPALSLYTNFLSDSIDTIKVTEATKPLFEGITFCILKHIGNRLYTSVFGRPRPATLQLEIEQSNPTDDIEDDENVPPDQNNELQQQQVRIEAPYLTHLLSRVMVAAPAHLGAFPSSKLAKAKQGTKYSLAVSAKDCLQRTLVNCMFGTEGEDENDLFRDCLKMPVPKDEVKLPKIKNEEMQEWFKKEMWRLLGWEILEMEGGL